MKKFVFAILLLLAQATQIFAQEEFVPPQAKLITKFPFIQLTGGIIIVRAAIDTLSTDSLNFVFDTGSGGISLDSTTVASAGIRLPSSTTI